MAYAIDLSPKSNCDQLINHSYFKICYSNSHKQALWTFHKISPAHLEGNERRTNDYRFDPKVLNPVDGFDYRGSGFDRGHLVPAADMKISYRAMSETFYMSNMSPQAASFNRIIWRKLEEGIREQVKQYGEAHVVTAPILEKGLRRIHSGVSIPKFFFKIAYFPKAKLMRAYLLENRFYRGKSYTDFQVTVDQVEEMTGIDFFHELDEKLQRQLESSLK